MNPRHIASPINPRRIISPVDFSDTTDAGLAPAISLATEFGSELVLLHVLNFPYPQMDGGTPAFDLERYYVEMEQGAEAGLLALVDEQTRQYASTRARVERGVPHREIVRVADDEGADLIVMPTHGRTGMQHMIFGSTAEKVVRLAPCPVLTVCPKEPPHPLTPERILLATDFSDTADQALKEALALACRYRAALTLLHVVTLWDSDPANPAWRFPAVPAEYRESVVDVAQEQLEGRRARCQEESLELDTLLVRGFDPAAEIVRVAVEDLDADLIVMGTHGHTGLAHALLGSIAEKVVRSSPRPVLTIRQPA